MNNVIKISSKGARQGGIGLKNILNEGIFTNVIYYTEFADGRKYVGQTTQGLLKRHKDHIKAHKPTHYDKILKAHMDEAVIYPICFGVEDIEDINTSDLLNGLEVAEIMLRETFNDIDSENGLNHTTGGYSYKISEAQKNKLSKIQKEIYNNMSDEEKEIMAKRNSESMKGNKNALGYKHTEEAKQKISKIVNNYWNSEEGQKQKEKNIQITNNYWNSEEGQKQKEKMSNERRIEVNAENILNYIDKYMTINETAKELNTSTTKITNELRRQGYDRFNYLRNQAISEDLIESKMTINEFATKHNIRTNDIKKALTQTGKKYMIKSLQ